MLVGKEIIKCELEYAKCFSVFFEDERIIRFRDMELPDMYCHNYTHIKKAAGHSELLNIIGNEIAFSLSEKKNFCNISLNPDIDVSQLYFSKYDPEISIGGYYSFDVSRLPSMSYLHKCTIKKVTDKELLEDILYCDLQHDEKRLGRDFCTRRCYRRGKVYLSDRNLNSYVCYDNDERVGTCDLFLYNGIAKIEDFGVIPKHQRKGYGTTILKNLIDTAVKENSHTIYLVTDEEDTAKEMYEKIGFTKIGEKTDLLFRI